MGKLKIIWMIIGSFILFIWTILYSNLLFAQYSVDKDTLGLWKFDEGSGDICKDETGKNNGKIGGAGERRPEWVKGKFGSALKFSGVGGYVGLTLNPYSAEELKRGTIEAWINPFPEGKGKRRLIVDIEGVILFELYEGNQLMLSIYDGKDYKRATSAIPVPFDEWSHVAGTWNSRILKVYVNSKEVGSQDGAVPALDKFSNMATFGIMYDGPLPFYGTIDEIKISSIERF